MGYTHYWELPHTEKQKMHASLFWEELEEQARLIIEEAKRRGIALAWEYDMPDLPPQAELGRIRFNGVGEDSCETFLITSGFSPYSDSGYCKTARNPYDAVVCAILAVAVDMKVLPGVRTDGANGETGVLDEEWKAAEDLLIAIGYEKTRTHTINTKYIRDRWWITWVRKDKKVKS